MFDKVDLVINKKDNNIIKIWLMINLLFLTVIISTSMFYEYKVIKTYQATVVNQNNNYYLNLYLTDKELLKFNQKKIYIDDEMVNKKVIAISTDYILTELGKFRLVTLETTINEIDKISNNVIEIKVHERNTTIMKELIDKLIEGGIYERT